MQTAVVSEAAAPAIEQLRMPIAAPRTPRPRVRSDALPEFTRYRDDGCDISASCLTCPLPRCRYEEPGGLRSLLNERRDRQIIALRLRGVPVDALADRFGISRRTVFRVIGSSRMETRLLEAAPTPIRQAAVAHKEVRCA